MKKSVISVAFKAPLTAGWGICIYKTSLLDRPNGYNGYIPSCPLKFYNKIAPKHH